MSNENKLPQESELSDSELESVSGGTTIKSYISGGSIQSTMRETKRGKVVDTMSGSFSNQKKHGDHCC